MYSIQLAEYIRASGYSARASRAHSQPGFSQPGLRPRPPLNINALLVNLVNIGIGIVDCTFMRYSAMIHQAAVESDGRTSLADVSQSIVGGHDSQPPRGTSRRVVVAQCEIVRRSQRVRASTTLRYIASLQRRHRHYHSIVYTGQGCSGAGTRGDPTFFPDCLLLLLSISVFLLFSFFSVFTLF